MKSKRIFVFYAVIVLIAYACGLGSDVTVKSFSPSGEVNQLTTFTVEFSDNIAPIEKQNEWLSDEFIEFEPKINGKFKWTSGSTLIFSPDQALQPIQSYKAKITNKVMFNSKLSYSFDDYEFNTPDFDAVKTEFFWSHIPNEKYKISIKANLYFNYPVNPEMLKDKLSIERDGSPVTGYQIVSEQAADVIAINLGDITQTEEDQVFNVVVKEGLHSIVGKKPLEDTREFKYTLPPLTKLVITGVTSGFDGQKGWIEVSTTQTVDEKQVRNFVKLTPSKNITFFVNENSFRIEGDFGEASVVNLLIKKGMPGLYGGELENEYEQDVSFVNLNPSISFADKKGKYLMLNGERNLQLNVVNIPNAEVEVSQIYKNNVLYFLTQYNNYYGYGEYDEDPYYYEGDVDRFGKVLYKENVKLKPGQNWLQKFNVNLNKIYEQKLKGIFLVQARSTEDRWQNASKMLALTDLGIIVKRSGTQLIVFVNSIATAEPVEGVDITLISNNNQTMASGKTNSEGVIDFKDMQAAYKEFHPRVLTAEKGDDFNFIDLNETYVETSRFDVGGARSSNEGYRTFIYGDRNLYRPGERVNITGIVRDDFTKTVKDVPVIIKVISPTGKIFDQFKKTLNEEGSFEITFDMPGYAQTGEYRTEVYTGAENFIGSYNFSIEDFVPDKIRLTLKSNKDVADPGETIKTSIDAEYLFGAKAAGLRYEADVQIRHKQFYSKKYSSYYFGNSSQKNSTVQNSFFDGTLDDQGKGEVDYVVPADLQSSGVATIYSFISVFDVTGRTVNRTSSVDVFPQKYFVGIKSHGYYFSTNENIDYEFVAVDPKDNIAPDFKATAVLMRYEWQTVLKKDYSGRYYYASEQKEVKEWERDLDLSGAEKKMSFAVVKSGRYELRIYKKGGSYYQSSSFYAFGWGSSSASSFQVDKEGRVEIVLDKQSYAPGDKAKILFTAPFSGKMLVTFERNNIYEYKYFDVKEKSTQMEFELKDSYIPNVYVTATLFKKHTADNTAPFLVGHGFSSIKVERKENKLPVTISAPKKVKPNTKQNVTIQTVSQRDIFVTLAAVDEGILQIKNYSTPDPYGFMYAKRALEVSGYDLYKLLLPEIISLKSTGGDELAKQLQKRANPIQAKRFNLVAVWSGILKTDGDGKVTVPLNIPQFNGEVRLMAVAYSGSRFGSGDAKMKVSDDLILEPQIPRFLAPGDSLVMPVTVINTTNKNDGVKVSVRTEGPLKVTSDNSESVALEPNSSKQVRFAITADKQVGTGKIFIETSGLAKVKEETEISVRPISPLVMETNSGTISANKEINLNIGSEFLVGTKNSVLTISKFPALKFAGQLKYLVGYPHGCIEQTVSKLFPQLYFEDLAKLVAPEFYKTQNPIYFVKEGIKKIESMQMWNGSMQYWQGWNETNWWGSVYAVHFLLEAKKAGFDVSENVLSKLLNYISTRSREKSTYDYISYRGNSRTVTKIANKEILYSLYVLALAGKGDISTMNYYKSRPNLLTNDTKYLLAGAYALMGKWNDYYQIVPPKFIPEITQRETGGCFDSDIRSNAIMLNVLVEVEPSSKQIPFIIKYLSDNINRIWSTQERSFTFLGLGKAARKTSDANVKVDVFADGKKIGTFNNNDTNMKIGSSVQSVTLKSSGNGEVYYFMSTEGVKTTEVKEEDMHMNVRRKYYDYRTRAEITGNNFYQGQMIVCRVSLGSMDIRAQNIAISDLIPSGFEIENPRLSETNQLQNWDNSNKMYVQYMDIRDDRLILFTNLDLGTRNFYYMLRVVNQGKFQLPAISGDAMYDPEIRSVNGRGVVKVSQR